MAETRVQFGVGGMSCSFCADTIDAALGRLDGVEAVDVSLAHEEVLVRYDDDRTTEFELRETLGDLGYTIRDPDREDPFEAQQAELDRGRRRLLAAGAASLLTLGLMGVMVARHDWNLFAETDARWMWWGALSLALFTMFGPGRYITGKAWQSLRRGILNQHVLLEAGAFAGLLGGLLGWLVLPAFPVVHFLAVATLVTTYHILSEYTSLVVRTRASRAVQELLDLRPDTARRVTADGDEEVVAVSDVAVGDRVRVRPGEQVPVDGEVLEGASAVDESLATGESAPVDKGEGNEVVGGSLNRTGTLLVRVTATGDDAFLQRVTREVEAARAMKPDVVRLADRVLRYFVPGVLAVAGLAALFWTVVPAVLPGVGLGTGPQVATAVYAALAVLVLGYPCALGMATPLALVRGGGEAAARGILLRSADAFQVLPAVDHVVLDKTGTVTRGEPAVEEVVGLERPPREVLRLAAAAEAHSEHPLAEAIRAAAAARDLEVPDPAEFDSVTGRGVVATVAGSTVRVGKPDWLADAGVSGGPRTATSEAAVASHRERLHERGLTVSGVAVDGDLVGLVGIGDPLKRDAAETVARLRAEGTTPVLLTGDDERTAAAVADAVGIDRVRADVLPDEKRAEVRALQDAGHRVAMVGDGINDAPALTQADVGIAIGAGTDVAIESADVVLLGDRLGGVVDAREIAARSLDTTRQNLAAAFAFNGVGVAAATTGLVHPAFAMVAMVLSVSAVLANSFGGQLVAGEGVDVGFAVDAAPPDALDDRERPAATLTDESRREQGPAVTAPEQAPARRTTAFEVDLACEGCERRVRNRLGDHEGVTGVEAAHETETVRVEFDPQATRTADLAAAIRELGFRVSGD